MARRINFENSCEIGVFMKLTNKYCLVPHSQYETFSTTMQNELGTDFPVVISNVAGIRIVGRMSVGNSKGLLLPTIVSETELAHIKEYLPEDIQTRLIDERLSALGNCLVCNDQIGLAHPDISFENEELITDTLGIELYRTTISGNGLVGSYCSMNNYGGLVHPMISAEDLDELSNLLEIPLCGGTVNRGSDVIGAGVIVNDQIAFCGIVTTPTETNVIEDIFKLNDVAKNPDYGIGLRTDLIEGLV